MADIAELREPEALPDGVYDGILDGTEISDGKYGPRRRCLWTVNGHTTSRGDPFSVSTWCDVDFSEKADANDWLEALGHSRLSRANKSVDWTALYGRPVTLLLTIGKNGYNEVAKVSAPRPTRAANGATTSPAPTVDPDFAEFLAFKAARTAAPAEPPPPTEAPTDSN